jgi:hypothetical protein
MVGNERRERSAQRVCRVVDAAVEVHAHAFGQHDVLRDRPYKLLEDAPSLRVGLLEQRARVEHEDVEKDEREVARLRAEGLRAGRDLRPGVGLAPCARLETNGSRIIWRFPGEACWRARTDARTNASSGTFDEAAYAPEL